ncbi:formate dehydrogenase subunit alpha [Nannocystis sp. ILAH1]|uniref:formate dehydrogenase subunit alpha n=1 Tax=Nannocystis sp. ILAH1 TaxID=2996789 RepID=UPI00226FDFC3|nr:formate dehydrogenase subunit alpha [Nannocystis sp. ILAH1]MCY0992771.1 formate dehydrogenase subunit alpha [Nannocystis sp. ILAH1]
MSAAPPEVELTIDGVVVRAPAGSTIWEAARAAGIEIPVLCHDPRYRPVGVCRMCVVDVGGRVLAASCVRPCEPGMKVTASGPEIEAHRKLLTALLLADQPQAPSQQRPEGSDLVALGRRYGLVGEGASADLLGLPRGTGRPQDPSSPVIGVDHQACILCDRCVRACDELQSNEVITRSGKGYGAKIAFDLDLPMGSSSCVSCGECMDACPTDALVNKPLAPRRRRPLPLAPAPEPKPAPPQPTALTQVPTLCPYCGVGCSVTAHVDEANNKVAWIDGRDSRVSDRRLCVKGRYGFDYATHPQRLTQPLIRREDSYPKGPLSSALRVKEGKRPGGLVDYAEVMPHFREASWDEALDLVARRLLEIRERHGSSALAGFGSAKGSNEEAYLFQKLVRVGFGTNNVDHCTRLCHASSVAALMETIGSGAVSTTFRDIENSDVALLVGTNATSNHPVAATFFKQAAKRGCKLLVIDPHRPQLADFAHRYVRIRPGTDVAFFNGVLHEIIRRGLYDRNFVAERTEGFERLKATVEHYSPKVAAQLCGLDEQEIVDVAVTWGSARAAICFWGMGVSQHVHGTDNARCLISLVLLTGQVGRPGTGLHPLRGQNNVQGASDAGLIPMVFPDYQSVKDPAIRGRFEAAWGTQLDAQPGLTVVEIMHAALLKDIRGMYVQGENPFVSDPNTEKVRKALAALDFLVVQDIFMTETAEFADVVLPASSFFEKTGTYTNTDRRVQIGRPVLKLPGAARLDWDIMCEIGRRMGAPGFEFTRIEDVFAEFAALTESYRGLSYESLGLEGKLWPCKDPVHEDGQVVLFERDFPSGRGKFVPAEFAPPNELPSPEFPFVLTTGRLLEHWHTGTMTRRASALETIESEPYADMRPADMAALGLLEGDEIAVTSRRGSITLKVRASEAPGAGSIFIPFCWREAAANVLTSDALDPFGKIPEFKFSAVRVEKLRAPTLADLDGAAE